MLISTKIQIQMPDSSHATQEPSHETVNSIQDNVEISQDNKIFKHSTNTKIMKMVQIQKGKFRMSCPEAFLVKRTLKIGSKFTGGHSCRSVISIKLQSKVIEITFPRGCSPVNLLHIFRKPIFLEHLWVAFSGNQNI